MSDIKLPDPCGYYYEWDGPYGKRKFSMAPHNGNQCDRAVAYYTADQVRAAVLADRAARAETWQPIAAAPKDGTRVLIWGPNSDTVVCYWNEWAHEPKWQPAAVEASGAQGYPDVTIRGEPTHWMPLPDAPTQERGADDE